ncbi:MAG: hypothetical protein ACYTFA_19375 [Planctomycetota bacterium]|jgi:hypothetical protein
MKHAMFRLSVVAVLTPLLAHAAFGEAVGTAFTYQGQLKQVGVPVSSTCDFVFFLVDSPTDPMTELGSQAIPGVEITNGLFTVDLDFGSEPFGGDARWLFVAVCCPEPDDPPDHCLLPQNFTMLNPPQKLAPAPYALYALASGAAGEHWAANGADIYSTNTGNVGIGTTTPAASLQVTNEGGSHAIWAESPETAVYAHQTSTSGTSPAVEGISDSLVLGAAGIRGVITSSSAGLGSAAVQGVNKSTSDAGVGVWGSQDGSGVGVYGAVPDGTAVLGSAGGTSGTNYGVRGRSWSPDGYGVQGDCSVGTGVLGIGGATSGVNYGVHGQTNSPDGYAGYFTGGRNYFEGNVGIGDEDPDYPLTIFNDTSGNAMWASGQVHLDRAGTALKIIHRSGGITKRAEFDGSHINSSGAPQTPSLHLNNSSSGDVILAEGGGKVGIGTSVPWLKLHVEGDAVVDGDAFVSGDAYVTGGLTAGTLDIGYEVVESGSPGPIRIWSASCPSGKKVLGGGCWGHAQGDLSYPLSDGSGWECWAVDDTGWIRAYAICANVN